VLVYSVSCDEYICSEIVLYLIKNVGLGADPGFLAVSQQVT